jgi:hypothetical protein
MDKMPYDFGKYREKREKVLGVKKRGMSFGTIAIIVSICIVSGLALIAAPGVVNIIVTRDLDDAIYKIDGAGTWPKDIISEIQEVEGVKASVLDKNSTRLVVTFNRKSINTEKIEIFFKGKGLKSTLLNRVSHRQRMKTLKEEKEIEAL